MHHTIAKLLGRPIRWDVWDTGRNFRKAIWCGDCADRETAILCAISQHRERLLRGELQVTRDDVLRELSQAKFLGCWCPLGTPCHVHTYLAILEGKL
jgi:hypothetical protein